MNTHFTQPTWAINYSPHKVSSIPVSCASAVQHFFSCHSLVKIISSSTMISIIMSVISKVGFTKLWDIWKRTPSTRRYSAPKNVSNVLDVLIVLHQENLHFTFLCFFMLFCAFCAFWRKKSNTMKSTCLLFTSNPMYFFLLFLPFYYLFRYFLGEFSNFFNFFLLFSAFQRKITS